MINPTVKQSGGLIGSLLASIGIPLALELGSKLFGKGLTMPRKAGNSLSLPRKAGNGLSLPRKAVKGLMTMPKLPPPFYGNWEGRGKKKGSGLLLGPNSPFQHIPLIGTIL